MPDLFLRSLEDKDEVGNPTNLRLRISDGDITISGTVKFAGDPVEGVKVHLINTTDNVYVGNQTSDVNGEFSFVGLDRTKEYHAVPGMYFDGEIDWSTFSKPFINEQ